jgi:hypothetical protein
MLLALEEVEQAGGPGRAVRWLIARGRQARARNAHSLLKAIDGRLLPSAELLWRQVLRLKRRRIVDAATLQFDLICSEQFSIAPGACRR